MSTEIHYDIFFRSEILKKNKENEFKKTPNVSEVKNNYKAGVSPTLIEKSIFTKVATEEQRFPRQKIFTEQNKKESTKLPTFNR